MAGEIASLLVRIGADANGLVAEFGRADKALTKTTDNYALATKAAAAFTAGAAATAAAIAVVVMRAAEGADAFYKQAQAAGMSTRSLSEYAYVAKLTLQNSEALGPSLAKLNRNISEAATGSGDAAEAFRLLGINVRGADGALKGADVMLEELAGAFSQFNDEGPEKAALAVAIFGKSGAEMLPMLNAGAQGLKRMREEARELGVTIDTETGRAAEEFNDNLTRLGQVQQGMANQLMRELLPSMNLVTEALVAGARQSGDLTSKIGGLASMIQGAFLTAFQTAAVVGSDVAFVFDRIGSALGAWAAQLAAIARGDFKGARLIGEEYNKDSAKLRKDLDEFQSKIMNLKPLEKTQDGGAMDMGVGLAPGGVYNVKGRAPNVAGAAELRKEHEEREQAVRDAIMKASQNRDEIQKALNPFYMSDEEREKAGTELVRQIIAMKQDVDAKIAAQIMNPTMDEEATDPERDARLVALRQQMKTQEELEIEAHAARMARLEEFSNDELGIEGGKAAARERLEQEHRERLNSIRGQGNNKALAMMMAFRDGDMKSATGHLAALTANLSGESRKMFELNKIAGIANVAIKGVEAVMGAYAWGNKIGGPPLGAAAAAVAGGFYALQAAAIAGQQFGGGGAAPSVAGSTPAQPVTPVSSGEPGGGSDAGRTLIVNLPGEELVHKKHVRTLFGLLNEGAVDGARLNRVIVSG